MAKTNNMTEVGRHEWMWVPEHRLEGLRRFVDVELAKQGLNHTKAAERAKVSKSHWSNVVNGERITQNELKVVSKGLKIPVKEILAELEVELEAEGGPANGASRRPNGPLTLDTVQSDPDLEVRFDELYNGHTRDDLRKLAPTFGVVGSGGKRELALRILGAQLAKETAA